jgi:hypothetical protein
MVGRFLPEVSPPTDPERFRSEACGDHKPVADA